MRPNLADLMLKVDEAALKRWPIGEHLGIPKINFQLEKDFGYSGRVIAREFLVDLNELSGNYIWPVEILDSCIIIRTCCRETTDFRGADFRHLFLVDSEYHSLFDQYSVSKISLHGFDNSSNYDNQYLIGQNGVPFKK